MALDDFMSKLDVMLESKLNDLKISIVDDFKSTFLLLQKEIQSLQESHTFLSAEYDDLKKEVQSHKLTITDLRRENAGLTKQLNICTTKINQLEFNSRSCNIEFQNIPENRNENLVKIVKTICEKVSAPIQDENIVACRRIAKLKASSQRPRNVLLSLPTPRYRDEILSAIYRYNKVNRTDKLNTQLIGMPGNKIQIYATEHLAAEIKDLHAKSRALAKQNGYKFVWIRYGRILVRKTDTSKPLCIVNEDCLKNITS